MESAESGIMKIYAANTDRVGTKLFYEYMVSLAKERGISGATVYRGIMGFGSSSNHISSSRFWELTEKLPVMIEIIDKSETLINFYKFIEPELNKMPKGCLVTIEPIQILFHKSGQKQ
jgi:uncharacterized protein